MRDRIGLLIVGLVIFMVSAFILTAPLSAESIGECITKSGYSGVVYERDLAAIAGVDAWQDMGETVLIDGYTLGWEWLDTDSGRRPVSFHAYRGGLYVFVYMHRDDPRSGEPPVWHGDCFLRVSRG